MPKTPIKQNIIKKNKLNFEETLSNNQNTLKSSKREAIMNKEIK